MAEKAIVMFRLDGESRDLELPLDITANELLHALNTAFSLGVAEEKLPESCLKAEDPIVLVRGNKTLGELGVRNGTTILFDR